MAKEGKLSPKERAFQHYINAVAVKLYALKELGRHLGMFGIHRIEPPEKNQEVCDKAVLVILNPNAHLIQKIACSYLLDYYDPEWKATYPKEVVGYIVQRGDAEVMKWRRIVIERDGGACANCGLSDKIEAHHIFRWVDFPHARLFPENGIALCKKCHNEVHSGNT